MEHLVQSYLRSGKTLDDLNTELSIKYNVSSDGLVNLNYHQIDSPTHDPIVVECRSLILETGTWNLVSKAFNRFFAYNENVEFDFEKSIALEKVDGSLIHLFNYNGIWRMSTRSVIDGNCRTAFGTSTFKELFDRAVSNCPNFWNAIESMGPDRNYVFELVSPESKVVIKYPETELYLLAIRNRIDKNTMVEEDPRSIPQVANILGTKYPKIYLFTDPLNLISRTIQDTGDMDEGIVFVNYSPLDNNMEAIRIKLKTEMYRSLFRCKNEDNNININSVLTQVILGDASLLHRYFPEFDTEITNVEELYQKYMNRLEHDIETVKNYKFENRKEYALYVKENCINLGVMMNLYDNKIKTAEDWKQLIISSKGFSQFTKNMQKNLGL